MRTLAVDYGDVHITLAASTLIDGGLRRDLLATFPEAEKTSDAQNFAFFITQVQDCAGLDYPFKKLTANPGLDVLHEMMAAWMQIEEGLSEAIVQALLTLRRPPGSGEKKA
jgi:hypothetical protein